MYININNLSFKYKHAKEETIRNFSIEINKGEILSIFGDSGSGKSTVLRLISGLEIPSNGSIIIDGKKMVDKNHFVMPEKRGIGMVFQDYALFPHMTVKANIKFGLKNMTNIEKNKRITEVLQLVNLEEYKERYPYELSGGQQQRVALARALAPNPSLLLLDEPFSNLDADLQKRIRDDLKAIINKTGITSIFVTHDKDDSRAIANRVVVLNKGSIIKVGAPYEILD